MKQQKNPGFEPAHSFLYGPGGLRIRPGLDADEALAKVSQYVEHPFNPKQKAGVRDSFERRLSMVWGPPGTGKTTVIAGGICGWLEWATENGGPFTVCVGAANYNAIDNVLSEVLCLLERRKAIFGESEKRVQVIRLRSDTRDPPQDSRIVDQPYSSAGPLADAIAQRDGQLVIGGTFQQLQKLSGNYNKSIGGKEVLGVRWFDLLVLDEASQIPVATAAAYFLLLREDAHVIMAGDHKQLGPVYPFAMQETHKGLLDCAFAYMREAHGVNPVALDVNYRTNELIAAWPAERFYEEGGYRAHFPERKLDITLSVTKPGDWPAKLPWSSDYARVLDPGLPVAVLTYPDSTCTLSNPFEAETVAALAHLYYRAMIAKNPAMTLREFWTEHLGLVTPHRAQMATIRNLLGTLVTDDASIKLFVDTVNRFQGQERDLIISSYVVSDRDFIGTEEEFILDPRRFNVTLTRARMKFVLLMSRSLLDHLPADASVATNAADIQLFVEEHCEKVQEVLLPRAAAGTRAVAAVLRGKRFPVPLAA